MEALQAGIARTTITPSLGMYLIGYADRSGGCKSIHDDLTGTALVLDDGATTLVIVALDMLALNECVVARVRAGIAEQWQIPAKQVMICCSHTHSGPIAYAGEKSKRKNRQFIDGLVSNMVAVVGEALNPLLPATMAWARGEAYIALNRRQRQLDGSVSIGVNPVGAVDRSLNVLQVRQRGSGQSLATLVNFACHATTLGPSCYAVSADWPGAMRRTVEAATGAPCMFLQGAAGNLNPDHDWGDDDLEAVERLGRQVAKQVLALLPELEPFAASPMQSQSQAAKLPIVLHFKPGSRRPYTYREVLAREAKVPRFLVDLILNARYPWQTTLEQSDRQWHVPMEIQAFRLGTCAIVAHAAETFNEVGEAIKARSPVPLTLFAGYSNGCVGYLPTAAEHDLGGYEIQLTPYIYRMPGVLAPACEALVTDQSLRILETLWRRT
jgi:neutral ceramidase